MKLYHFTTADQVLPIQKHGLLPSLEPQMSPDHTVVWLTSQPDVSLTERDARAMAIFVRCIDNTLAADVLVVGEIYEVMHINERDGYYALSGLGRFTMTRFKLVSAAEAGYWPSRRRRSSAGEEPNSS